MADHNELGARGEDEAVNFLIKKGYRIKERNWRFAKAEIDIIAENDEWLVMVEVKTRSNDSFGSPEEFVSKAKQKHLIRAANRYLELFPTDKDTRFDIISIVIEPKFLLEHIPEAFYP
ncbi:YraN family protein [Owenweeksia hongkongensis]|uniref:YraN family protein n=1 Tax=Owenweeksia hongkongensis TaxID=253245 RepID=UPI003A942940